MAVNARRLTVPAAVSGLRVVVDRGGLGVAVGFYLVVVSVLSSLWRAAAGVGHGQVAGYSAVALTWYIATSEAAICALNIRMIEEIGDDIGSGRIAVELLRPLPAIAVRLTSETGRGIARLAAMIVSGAVLAWLVAGGPPNTGAALLAVPSLVLAVVCNLAMQHFMAAAAFWVRDAKTTWFLYQKVVFILGGMLIPLQVLPAGLRTVAFRLPFMAMAYAPARLASGHFEPELLVVQAGWLAVAITLAVGAFAAGQRRLQVAGG
jgi:ABC-2 type transport system permease protein